MKKIKLMLLSLSILAVVGGALAFTAKSGAKFCVVTTTSSTVCPAHCTNLSSIKDRILATDFVCTTPTSGIQATPCKDGLGADLPCPAAPINKTVE